MNANWENFRKEETKPKFMLCYAILRVMYCILTRTTSLEFGHNYFFPFFYPVSSDVRFFLSSFLSFFLSLGYVLTLYEKVNLVFRGYVLQADSREKVQDMNEYRPIKSKARK
jgi:hypothetical protein